MSREARYLLRDLRNYGHAPLEIRKINEATATVEQILARCADVIEQQDAQIEALRATLAIIALPARPDGTWNRDREACRQLADTALRGDTAKKRKPAGAATATRLWSADAHEM